MNEIYNLIGKIIHAFQELEEHLAILVYCHYYEHNDKKYSDIRKTAIEQYSKMDGATLGQKLHQILCQNLMSKSDEDYIVLEYLTNRRNYIAHNFFVENSFKEQSDIDEKLIELTELLQQVQLVEKGYGRMLRAELQHLNII